MKKRLLPLVLAASLLASCGAAASSSSSSALDSSSSTSSENDSSAQSSSSAPSSSSDSGSSSSSSSSLDPVASWSDDEIALFEEYFGEGIADNIPYIGLESYEFAYDSEYRCFSILGEATEDDQTAILDTLETFGYTVTAGGDDDYYSLYLYNDTDGIWTYSYVYDGYLCLYIYQHTYIAPTILSTWDTDAVSLFDTNFYSGASEEIPAYIPYAPETVNSLTDDYLEDYGCLSVYYDHGGEKEVNDYISILLENGFALDDTELYAKTIEDKGTIYVDVYLDVSYAYNADYYFSTPTPEQPSTGTVTITPADITGLAYGTSTVTAGDILWNLVSVMAGKSKNNLSAIQLKKLEGSWTNASALAPLESLTIVQDKAGDAYDGTYTVYAGTSSSSLSVVTGTDGTYALNGATFFAIKDESPYVVYLTSISFTFKA